MDDFLGRLYTNTLDRPVDETSEGEAGRGQANGDGNTARINDIAINNEANNNNGDHEAVTLPPQTQNSVDEANTNNNHDGNHEAVIAPPQIQNSVQADKENSSRGVKRKWNRWTTNEIEALKDGVSEFGEGEWALIVAKYEALKNRSNVSLKDKWRNIQLKEEEKKNRKALRYTQLKRLYPAERKKCEISATGSSTRMEGSNATSTSSLGQSSRDLNNAAMNSENVNALAMNSEVFEKENDSAFILRQKLKDMFLPSFARVWTVEETVKWLNGTEFSQYVEYFEKRAIDGSALWDLVNGDLEFCFSMASIEECERLLNLISTLFPEKCDQEEECSSAMNSVSLTGSSGNAGWSEHRPSGKFQEIPEEMLIYIYKFLSPRDILCSAAPVCRRWKSASDIPLVWRHISIPSVNAHFGCERKFIAGFLSSLMSHPKIYKNIRSISFGGGSLHRDALNVLKAIPSLKKLTSFASEQLDFMEDFSVLRGLTELDFYPGNLHDPVFEKLSYLTELESLTLRFRGYQPDVMDSSRGAFKRMLNSCVKLKTLIIEGNIELQLADLRISSPLHTLELACKSRFVEDLPSLNLRALSFPEILSNLKISGFRLSDQDVRVICKQFTSLTTFKILEGAYETENGSLKKPIIVHEKLKHLTLLMKSLSPVVECRQLETFECLGGNIERAQIHCEKLKKLVITGLRSLDEWQITCSSLEDLSLYLDSAFCDLKNFSNLSSLKRLFVECHCREADFLSNPDSSGMVEWDRQIYNLRDLSPHLTEIVLNSVHLQNPIFGFDGLASLKIENGGGRMNTIEFCPGSDKALKSLVLRGLPALANIKANFESLKEVTTIGCRKLTDLPALHSSCKPIESLTLVKCSKSFKLPNIGAIDKILTVDLQYCDVLMAAQFQNPILTEIHLHCCKELEILSFNGCINLKRLKISGCNKLESFELPSNKNCPSLIDLQLYKCESLVKVKLNNRTLKYLQLQRCRNVNSLFLYTSSLKELAVCNMPKLSEEFLLKMPTCKSMRYLLIRNNPLFKDATSNAIRSKFPGLRKVDIAYCLNAHERKKLRSDYNGPYHDHHIKH
eukprot:Nk52_evm9s136 gene=Nk52_evmTU9s136